jgi:FtsZ-binding cell division protein ZapB
MRATGLLMTRPPAALLWLFFILPVCAATADREQIEDTRSKIEKWIETKRLISQEKRDLELAKEMLSERIKLVQREITALQGKMDDAQKSIDEVDNKRAGMVEENEKLKQSSSALTEVLFSLEERTRQLLKRLPDPICQRIKPLSQRLPEQSGQTKLSVSERFQNLVGILNEVDKFNREITVTSEVRNLHDSTTVEVATIYLGIGQAFYASADGRIAGIGTASDEGWIWKSQNEASAQIADVIAILKNEKVASFVKLPIEIH